MKPTRYASRSGSPASSEGAVGPVLVTGASGYYLVHSLGSRGRFEEEEERAAHTFAAAARAMEQDTSAELTRPAAGPS